MLQSKNVQKRQKSKIKIIVISLTLIIILAVIVVFGRYITSTINDFYLRSKEFYFYSDKLKATKAIYQVENWSGLDTYTITVNMNSMENNLKGTSYDIPYKISYSCSDNVDCQLSKTEGIIKTTNNTDYFNLMLVPNRQLKTGDEVWVEIKAESEGQYKKTLEGRFTLVVGKESLTYKIEDETNTPYIELSLTNSLSYYIVTEKFDSYNVGDRVSVNTYLSLSEENKNKCYSSIVELNFDPKDVVLDMTDINYSEASDIKYTNIDGYNYVNGFTVELPALSSMNVRFYKNDKTKDYTFNGEQGQTSIIDVNNLEI